MTFDDVFKSATDGKTPYDYQRRLACGERNGRPDEEWLAGGRGCQSQLINIPTGLGKTAAVVLAWLWNRVLQPDEAQRALWPRRLVYCLPMRTLVEQTESEVRKWLGNLLEKAGESVLPGRAEVPLRRDLEVPSREQSDLRFTGQALEDLQWLAVHSPVILMGGEDLDKNRRDWDIHPEKPAILIGTQDMLLSRALNRGYGMSRYRWPMHFALLNNDCLWVMDETQLMGVGVETSAQLDGFRHRGPSPTFGSCPTWWMSATLSEDRLSTVDHQKPAEGWPSEKLSEEEQNSGRSHELITARKSLSVAPFVLNSATKASYAKHLAAYVVDHHKPGTLTLVVLNRVARAREVFESLTEGKKPLYPPERAALIHSRFRPVDRERHTKLLFEAGDRVVIATQAVEAGVDVSARLLITELAPWSSLVQRVGRCNRRADIPDAEVLWVDIQPKDDKDELLRPYSETELKKARIAIADLSNASAQALREVTVAEEDVIRPLIRRRDLLDFFDTTPDVCGQDIDVSRYLRDGEDNDVQFFWRNIQEGAPTDKESPPHRNELCRVSIGDAKKFFGKKPRAWCWDPLSEEWKESKTPRPGVVYLVDVKSGGYSDATGWTGDPKDNPTPRPPKDGELPKYAGNRLTFAGWWQSLEEHTELVVKETERLAAGFFNGTIFDGTLRTAAFWHDLGKTHADFQAMLRNGDASRVGTFWAKSAHKGGKCSRRGFRHELASALAWLLVADPNAPERDLVAYLIAAHHGKVRLSIRSLPQETGNPKDPGALFARGIWQGDELPLVSIGELKSPKIALDLSFMQMGESEHGPSWLARTVALRDRLGPFRLAFLETLLRAADAIASTKKNINNAA